MVASLRAPLVAFLTIHLVATPVVAQTTVEQASDASSWSTLAKALKHGTRLEMTRTEDRVADRLDSATKTPLSVDIRTSLVTVTLRDKRVVSGYIDSLREHSFFVIDPQTGVVTQVGYRQVANLSATSGKTRLALTVVVLVGVAVTIWLLGRASGDDCSISC